MSRSSRELIDYADQRIREVQRKMNQVQMKQTTVFHGTLDTGLMPALQSLQMYVDQWMLDPSFPWQRHWLPHIVELTTGSGGDDDKDEAADRAASPFQRHQRQQERQRQQQKDVPDAAAATERMLDFMERAEAALSSGVAAGRGTVKQLELCVLYHVTMLVQKILGSQRVSDSHREAARESEASKPVPAPSSGLTEEESNAASASPATLPSSDAGAGDGIAAQSNRNSSPLTATRLHQTTPTRSRARPTTATVESPRHVAGGVEYVRVDMGIANRVCRPKSGRVLGAKKDADTRIQGMLGALQREAPAINARDGPLIEVPQATSRLRSDDAAAGETPRPWAAEAEPTRDAAATPVGAPDDSPVYRPTPSIRKPTAPIAGTQGSQRGSRSAQHHRPSTAGGGVAAQQSSATRMAQQPMSGVVTVGAAGCGSAEVLATSRREASRSPPSTSARTRTPRVGVASVPTRQWGVRMLGDTNAGKAMQGRAASTRWTLVSHEGNAGAGLARHTQTVCVTSAATKTHGCDPVGGSSKRGKGSSWSTMHDAKWIAPQMKPETPSALHGVVL